MKTSHIRKIGVLVLTAFLAVPAVAQEDALKDYPGYVDFGELNSIFGEPTVQISIGESLLGLVGSLSAKEDPEAAEVFKRLNGVRVNVFESIDVPAEGVDLVKDISAQLSDRGWESVVTVNSEDEQVRIFMMISDDRVEGITVMAVEPTEAVFVNVIGNINPAELERVMDNFEVDINGSSDHDHDE
ncbi:MAG: DUF4252 domain-containing protein [Xanthomonadales bacterium]|nr:DUF4252 domain-containing protein [Xanthomonadales bacterium]